MWHEQHDRILFEYHHIQDLHISDMGLQTCLTLSNQSQCSNEMDASFKSKTTRTYICISTPCACEVSALDWAFLVGLWDGTCLRHSLGHCRSCRSSPVNRSMISCSWLSRKCLRTCKPCRQRRDENMQKNMRSQASQIIRCMNG